MWVITKEREPDKDGFYLVQMIYGKVNGLEYTIEGGWNTRYDYDGSLHAESAIEKTSVARWFDAPEPPEVLDIWFDEFVESIAKEAEANK